MMHENSKMPKQANFYENVIDTTAKGKHITSAVVSQVKQCNGNMTHNEPMFSII